MIEWMALVTRVVLNASANVLMKVGSNTAEPLSESTSVGPRVCGVLNAAPAG